MAMDFRIWVLFHFSILIYLFGLTSGQSDFWGQYCGTTGNYTQTSPYRQSLDDVLFSLTGTDNGFGFYNSSSGQDPNRANAAALCRGDTEPETCRRCVDDATRRLRQVCPEQMEATGFYDLCLLRYSNQTILGSVGVGYAFGWNRRDISGSSFNQWNQAVRDLLGGLRQEAAGGGSLRKYSSGNTSGPEFLTIYGFMQCTPDLSESQCTQCLSVSEAQIPFCCNGSLGGRVYRPSCVLRYEEYMFFNETWYPPPPPPPPPAERKKSTNIGVIVGPTMAAVAVMVILVFFVLLKRHKRKRKGPDLLPESRVPSGNDSSERNKHQREEDDTGEVNYFNLSTIQAATNNFAPESKLGEGGFGPVYRGKMQDGKEIAVKRLSRNSGQGLEEFKTEVKLIIKLQHKNLVRLLGYCVKGDERLLVYEFMANNSLDTFLFDPDKSKELDWAKRANIVSGIAKGLRYLHEDSRLKIIHRDMKASNVLLDNEMNAKISDFGTARIFGGNQMEALTNRIVGTYGYMAPEYAMEGLFSTKSDVYSFGVLLLEIICGQKNNRFHHQEQPKNFLAFAWRLWTEGKGIQLIDQQMIHNCPVDEALRCINIALLCVQEDPQDRPTMSNVVFMLEGQWTSLPVPSEPPLSFARLAVISDESTTTGGGTGHRFTGQTSSTNASSQQLTR